MTQTTTVSRRVWVTGRDKSGTVLSRTGGYELAEDWSIHDPALLNAKAHRDEMRAKNLLLDGEPVVVNYAVEVEVETTTVDTHDYPIDFPEEES